MICGAQLAVIDRSNSVVKMIKNSKHSFIYIYIYINTQLCVLYIICTSILTNKTQNLITRSDTFDVSINLFWAGSFLIRNIC